MKATLYVVPGSHPSRTAELMLQRKGIDYKRTDLVPQMHKPVLRALGFPSVTVPAIKIDGRKIQGSRAISKALDELRPDPPLFPSDTAQREAVEEAELWGDQVFQEAVRQIAWWCILHRGSRDEALSFSDGYKLGVPRPMAKMSVGMIGKIAGRTNNATEANVRRGVAELPGWLDKIDGWIAEGLLGGEEPNAADLQIATSVRLLMCLGDFKALLDDRPAVQLARRLVPDYAGHVSSVLPADWLPAPAAVA